jgi:hypothetical protein
VNPALRDVWKHMRDLGLGALAHANHHAAYVQMESEVARWPELSVLQAAHAAELLIKASIAQEHPLLIFEQLPRSSQTSGEHLAIEDLFRQGRTLQWAELPERLWAATGVPLPSISRYESFGRLRNGIQHFAAPSGIDTATETLRFVFEVIDPLINRSWHLFAIDYDEDYDTHEYLPAIVAGLRIPFLVSPEAAQHCSRWDVDWGEAGETYKDLMKERVVAAGGQLDF